MTKPPRAKPPRIEAESELTPDTLLAMLAQAQSSRTSRAVDAAQEIMFDAWEAADPRRRVSLARRALAISPLCADAHVLLAEETAKTPEEALEHYVRAVAAGEKALGKRAFKEDVGLFWGLIDTRPYMRARHGLASTQWQCGQHDEAIAGAQDMLRLNPNDNQGIRYILLDWLLRLARDAEAAVLLARYKNDGATEWLWPAALARYRVKGDSAAARTALVRAMDANKLVAAYLLGRKKPPRRLPEYIVWRSPEEAAAYMAMASETWAATPGALAWLAERAAPPAASPREKTPKRRRQPGQG